MNVVQSDPQTFVVPAGQMLTIAADSVSAGTVYQLGNQAGNPSLAKTAIAASQSTIFGPFNTQTRWRVEASAGLLSATMALASAAQIVAQGDETGSSPLSGTPGAIVRFGADGLSGEDSRITDDGINPVDFSGAALKTGNLYSGLLSSSIHAPSVLIGGDDTGGFGASLTLASDGNDASAPNIAGFTSQGTIASPAASGNGDRVFTIAAYGYDGSTFSNVGLLEFDVSGSGSVAAGQIPGKAVLALIQPDGSQSNMLVVDGGAKTITATADAVTGVINLNASIVKINNVVLAPAIVTNSTPTTGQTVSAGTAKKDETLYITPAGTLLALTVSLPAAADSRVGQIIRGFISQIITGLTVSAAGGGSVVGATPVTSAVNSTFAYQCAVAGTWIRIQ